LGFSEEVTKAIYSQGFFVPSLAQEQLCQKILSDNEQVIFIGPSGCGKTIGSVLALLHLILKNHKPMDCDNDDDNACTDERCYSDTGLT